MTTTEETMLKMSNRIAQLEMRLEDVAAMVAFLMPPVEDQPPPVDQVLAIHYGLCDHGRLLRDPCPDCQARTR